MPRWVQLGLRALAALALAGGIALAVFGHRIGAKEIAPTMIVLVAPALLVWGRPSPRAVGLWAVIAWFNGILFALTTWQGGPPWFVDLTESFLGGLLAILPVAAFGAAAATTGLHPPDSPLARRLRSAAATAIALGVGIGVLGFLPGVASTSGHDSRDAGGISLLLFVSLAVSPAILAYAEPRLRSGWRWMMWGLCLAAPAGAVLTFGYDTRYADAVVLWPRRAVELGVGTMLVLILVVLPIVLIASDENPPPPTLPDARIH